MQQAEARTGGPEQLLWYAGAFYLAAFSAHTLDHLLRGRDSVTEALYVAGFLSSLLSVMVAVLVLTRHRFAPHVAAAIGLPQAVAFFAAHFLPTWSALSDSFISGDVGWWTWVAGALEIVGALAVASAGLRLLSAKRRDPASVSAG